MIKFPDEIRFGAPVEHSERDEIRVLRYSAWRDEHEAVRTVDVQFELEPGQRRKLLEQLEAGRKPVFELADPHGSMPPDPMGPALAASVTYINDLSPANQVRGIDGQVVWTPDGCLAAMLKLRGAVLGAFSGVAAPSEYPDPPVRPENVTLPGHPALEAQVNCLLMAAYGAASVIYGTETFTTTGYSAAMTLLNVIHGDFTP